MIIKSYEQFFLLAYIRIHAVLSMVSMTQT